MFSRICFVCALVFLPGCAAVYYTGMPLIYDGVRLSDERTHLDMPYSELGEHDSKHRLDLYLPEEGANWSVLIFVHGGGWSSGDKALKFGGKEVYRNIGRYFANQGVAVAVVNYRLLPGVHWSTQMNDVATAVAWMQENASAYGARGDVLFLSGHSSGAHLASRIALDADLQTKSGIRRTNIRGVIAVSGAGFDMGDQETNRSGEMIGYLERRFSPVDNTRNWISDASVVQYIDAGDPPFLILSGGREPIALARQSELLKERLEESNVPVEMLTLRGKRHARMILAMSKDGPGTEAALAFLKSNAPVSRQTEVVSGSANK